MVAWLTEMLGTGKSWRDGMSCDEAHGWNECGDWLISRAKEQAALASKEQTCGE